MKHRYRIERNKGVREYQHIINFFLCLDNSRGMGYLTLAKFYKLDHKNIAIRIRTFRSKYEAPCKTR